MKFVLVLLALVGVAMGAIPRTQAQADALMKAAPKRFMQLLAEEEEDDCPAATAIEKSAACSNLNSLENSEESFMQQGTCANPEHDNYEECTGNSQWTWGTCTGKPTAANVDVLDAQFKELCTSSCLPSMLTEQKKCMDAQMAEMTAAGGLGALFAPMIAEMWPKILKKFEKICDVHPESGKTCVAMYHDQTLGDWSKPRDDAANCDFFKGLGCCFNSIAAFGEDIDLTGGDETPATGPLFYDNEDLSVLAACPDNAVKMPDGKDFAVIRASCMMPEGQSCREADPVAGKVAGGFSAEDVGASAALVPCMALTVALAALALLL